MISARTMESIDNIDRMMREASQQAALYSPLVRKLLPIRRSYLLAGRDPDGLGIHLQARNWQRQAEAGIDRCVGIDITWLSEALSDTERNLCNKQEQR